MISLSFENYYTTIPDLYVNGSLVRGARECEGGDTVEFRFRKLAGFTYSESFTLDGDALTISGVVDGDYEDGKHYVRFIADAAWNDKTVKFLVDIADKSTFKTLTASTVYDETSPYTYDKIADANGNVYSLYEHLVPVGANVQIQSALNGVAYGVKFDKLGASSVGITDSDLTSKKWSYSYYNDNYYNNAFITFDMPNNDVTVVAELEEVTLAEIKYYKGETQWSSTQYGPVDEVLGNNENNSILGRRASQEGYTFDGWYIDSELTTQATASTEIPSVGLNLYAKFVANAHTVTFNSNGGSAVPSQEVEDGEKATKPTDPTKAGAEFVNWYSDETLETVYDFNTVVTADITLYAKWNNLQNTVTFKEGDETRATVKVDDMQRVMPIEPLHPVDAEGNEFVYWALNNVKYDFTTPVDNDITLVAVYATAASSKWIMSLPNCFVGLKSDVDYLPKARVANGTKALALSANEGEETAYIFHEASLTWIELQHYTVNI